MKKSIIAVIVILAMMMSVSLMVGCSKRSATTPEEEPTAGPTSTHTVAVVPTPIDDFEDANLADGVFYANLLGGTWVASQDTHSSLTFTSSTDVGGGTYSGLITAGLNDNTGAFWAWTSVAGDLNALATAVDFNVLTTNGYTGLRLKMKGAYGTGSAANTFFLIQLPSTAQTNDVKYRVAWTPVTSWTTVSFPFSSFTVPGWAQGTADDKPRDVYYAGVRAIEFSIAAAAQPVSTSNTQWWIDDIEFY